jgi:hypothetical protein
VFKDLEMIDEVPKLIYTIREKTLDLCGERSKSEYAKVFDDA